MSEFSLQQGIEAWLPVARRQVVPRFPPALEAEFREDNAPSRLLALRVGAIVGTITGCLSIPSFWRLMPDAHAAIIWFWCVGALPIGLVSSIVLWARLPLLVQEAQTAIGGVMVAGFFTAMMMSTRLPSTAMFLDAWFC